MDDKRVEKRNKEWRAPFCDIFEYQDRFEVLLDMPGVDEKDLDITFQNGILEIVGHTSVTERDKFHSARHEYFSGDFKREFSLSEQNIAVDKINAELKDGELKLIMPKSEKVKPRKIEIKSF